MRGNVVIISRIELKIPPAHHDHTVKSSGRHHATQIHPNANMSAKKMAAIHWLDLLEKEFDKAFVDLDILLGEVDPDQCEITYEGRRKMTALSASFAQLCHKAQTIFQNNAKLEVNIALICARILFYGM